MDAAMAMASPVRGVAALARGPALRVECPEAGDGDGFALGEAVADGGENGRHHPVGRGLVEGAPPERSRT